MPFHVISNFKSRLQIIAFSSICWEDVQITMNNWGWVFLCKERAIFCIIPDPFPCSYLNVPSQSLCLASTSPWVCRTMLLLIEKAGAVRVCGWKGQKEGHGCWGLRELLGHLLVLSGLCGPINQGPRWDDTTDKNEGLCLSHPLVALPYKHLKWETF